MAGCHSLQSQSARPLPKSSCVYLLDAGESVDTDGDGIGNNADADDDGDGVADISDAFPLDNTESIDTDNDGVLVASDAFPLDPTRWEDSNVDDTAIWSAAQSSRSAGGGSMTPGIIILFLLIRLITRRVVSRQLRTGRPR